ncbi:AAA-ATPase ASD, mitochondrial-like [Vicia villosa]|uniref:AAA-ATPase ASD, mitochondrial-like n=1 Tax=Vicia villosa TaxID=3911 RepID=UPI00273B887A|nr:AAA-ATPase ASD, mitochondrial-like [Vicia villosa]
MGKKPSPTPNSISRLYAYKKKLWSLLGIIRFLLNMFEKFFSRQLHRYVTKYSQKLINFMSPYIHITFPYLISGNNLRHSEAYTCIKTYLSAKSLESAKIFNAEVVQNNQTPLVLTMGDNEEIMDEFNGVHVWWSCNQVTQQDSDEKEKTSLTLTFYKWHRELVTTSYIQHVLEEGKAMSMKKRKLKLYTNNPKDEWRFKRKWSSITFEHPARFETLAMDPKKKEEIINDLVKFKDGKEYYAKVGKAWKRGYLLFGPPGTGKSTMISAIANFMNYDVYDLELSIIKDNIELKRLLIATSNKSVIVIEDIDCSIDLTGKRKEKKDLSSPTGEYKVTLSGLLNIIDGIWSSCGGERIIIFTTNFVDKLDPALIRRGRMDMHIELSYCSYEAFKVLVKNYWDVESHDELFPIIEKLIGETNMTPADVAESLMPKSFNKDFETCLKDLIQSLENVKEKAK